MARIGDGTAGPDPAREGLSALVDGELDPQAAAGLLMRWRDDEEARHAWHAYQLIGDVLRSEDLAADARRERDFVQRLRGRLAAEPVVLAPAPATPQGEGRRQAAGSHDLPRPMRAARRWRRWSGPVGVAAGVTLVAGTLFVTRPDVGEPVLERGSPVAGGTGAATGQRAAAPAGVVQVAATAVPAAAPRAASGVLLRDARLDRYLAAHKQFQGANALGPTAGFIRSATHDAAAR